MNSNADGIENAIKRTIMTGNSRQKLNIEQLGKINENEIAKDTSHSFSFNVGDPSIVNYNIIINMHSRTGE